MVMMFQGKKFHTQVLSFAFSLGRINYYTDQKELSILKIPDVWESWRELSPIVPEVQNTEKMKTRANISKIYPRNAIRYEAST